MEYFTVNGEAENLTLQDMIECDIKSEFNEQCGSPEEIDLGLKTRLSEAVSVTDALNMEFSTQTAMDTTCSATLTALASDVDKKSDIGDLAWLQTVNVSDIQAVVVQPSAVHQQQDNSNDANLLVNPQTGVPVIQDPGLHSPHSQSAIAPVTVIQPMSPVAVRVTTVPQSVATTNALLNSPVNNNNVNINRVNFTNSTVSQATLIQPQVTRVYQHPLTAQQLLASAKQQRLRTEPHVEEKVYPKPVYSYSCLIAMALKNSETGALPVSEIYSFMTENFPYFKTAPDGWKNSVRHNLSLNKCFEKIENPKANGNTRKGCLWGLNPEKIEKMDEEITKWRKKDPTSVKRAMAKPEVLEMLEMGRLGSNSPRHPNNIKNMKNNNHLAGRLQQQQQLIPESPSKVLDTPMDTTTPLTTTSIINITPASTGTVVKMEPQVVHIVNTPDSLDTKSGMRNFTIKTEDTGTGVATGEVDLNILDTGLSMESQLPDLQGNLWDELGAEGINLDDLAASSLNFSFASVSSGNGSPITVQSASGVNASPLVTLLTNRTVPSSPATIPISSRTLFAAQT